MTPAQIFDIADAATREIHGDDYRIATRLVIERAIASVLSVTAQIAEMGEVAVSFDPPKDNADYEVRLVSAEPAMSAFDNWWASVNGLVVMRTHEDLAKSAWQEALTHAEKICRLSPKIVPHNEGELYR